MCTGGAPSTQTPAPPPPPTRLSELPSGQKAPAKKKGKKRSLRTVKPRETAEGAGIVVGGSTSPTL